MLDLRWFVVALAVGLLNLTSTGTAQEAPPAFTLKDGDRLVIVGDTLIEREPDSGYWETMLARRFPGVKFSVRNLGWSGDTPWAESRAGFGSAADGFKSLQAQLKELKPTIAIVGYGMAESFSAPAGLPKFKEGYVKLLDALKEAGATRFVFLGPIQHENLGEPLPNPQAHNAQIAATAQMLADLAKERQVQFIDLAKEVGDGTTATPAGAYTDNGIHYTAYGYWKSADKLAANLAPPTAPWQLEVNVASANTPATNSKSTGAKVSDLQGTATGVSLTLQEYVLPAPVAPVEAPTAVRGQVSTPRTLVVRGLKEGSYQLTLGEANVGNFTAAQLAAGVPLNQGPAYQQTEALRAKIIAKNQLYFHRWRPQNWTYLFGFRKHEQGQNAKEIPQFDPLVEADDAEIAKLSVPQPYNVRIAPAQNK